jgi:hypothetical protein
LTVTPSGHWVDYPVTLYLLKIVWSRVVLVGRWTEYPVTPYPLKTDWSREFHSGAVD